MFYFLNIKVKDLIGYRIVVARNATRDVGISWKRNAALVPALTKSPRRLPAVHGVISSVS